MILTRGKALKIARLRSGRLQREFAEELGIATCTYACIESGRRSPGPHVARLICKILNENFDSIIYF